MIVATWVPTACVALAEDRARWRLVFAEDFEKTPPGRPVGAPWKQRHPVRPIMVTDRVAVSGKRCAMFRYEISAKGTLDKERGLFAMEAPIPRAKNDRRATWRITAAMRFHPIAWTAASFRVRGQHYRSAVAVVNSGNLLFVGGNVNMPVWNVAKPGTWYRIRIILREQAGTYDIEVGPDKGTYRNRFYNLPVPPESLPLRFVGFGYCGALVRYGQGRRAYLDDVRVERLAAAGEHGMHFTGAIFRDSPASVVETVRRRCGICHLDSAVGKGPQRGRARRRVGERDR